MIGEQVHDDFVQATQLVESPHWDSIFGARGDTDHRERHACQGVSLQGSHGNQAVTFQNGPRQPVPARRVAPGERLPRYGLFDDFVEIQIDQIETDVWVQAGKMPTIFS